VAVLSRGKERLEATRRELEAYGIPALALCVDVADPDQVYKAADHVERILGPIDVWINNAMVSVFSPIWETKPEEYLRVTEVTYLGYVHGTLAALRYMRTRNSGCILQVGSALAFRGVPLQSAYCASKYAVRGFTDSLRSELMHAGSAIRICEVHLPAVNTPYFSWVKSRLQHKARPATSIFQPELAAAVIHNAVHCKRRHWFLGASTHRMVWGNRLMPGFLDRWLARKAYSSQQTSKPEDVLRPHNLWNPPPGDYGCHGVFEANASKRSLLYWLDRHRTGLAASAILLGAAVAGALWWKKASPLGSGNSGRGNSKDGNTFRENSGKCKGA